MLFYCKASYVVPPRTGRNLHYNGGALLLRKNLLKLESAAIVCALYPLSFKTFGNYGATWSPRELTDEQLAEQVTSMNERMAIYDKAAESNAEQEG
jgi:hypothetical protein